MKQTENNKNIFAMQLIKLMKVRGYDVKRLAKKLDISAENVYHYIRGEREPKLDGLKNICNLFKVSADVFILGLPKVTIDEVLQFIKESVPSINKTSLYEIEEIGRFLKNAKNI